MASVSDQEAGAGAGGGLPAGAGAAPSYSGARPAAGSCPAAAVGAAAVLLLQSLTAHTNPSWLTPQSARNRDRSSTDGQSHLWNALAGAGALAVCMSLPCMLLLGSGHGVCWFGLLLAVKKNLSTLLLTSCCPVESKNEAARVCKGSGHCCPARPKADTLLLAGGELEGVDTPAHNTHAACITM